MESRLCLSVGGHSRWAVLLQMFTAMRNSVHSAERSELPFCGILGGIAQREFRRHCLRGILSSSSLGAAGLCSAKECGGSFEFSILCQRYLAIPIFPKRKTVSLPSMPQCVSHRTQADYCIPRQMSSTFLASDREQIQISCSWTS